ncbi:taste receptor type 2 member 5 [Saccopteryx leptura]|uniref:taste receptor type 2 member 5 n=1 Tax=Saccopteryx leptura TaxID=249018 RepID=UPI00339BC4EB
MDAGTPSPAAQVAILGLLMAVAGAEFLIGLVGNGVLMVWSLGEWVRKCKGSSYQLIVLGLASCRFLLQCLIMVDLILFPFFESSCWLRSLNLFWVVVSQVSLWLATFLSVFYCKKIATFEHPAYLWLKQRAYCLSGWCLLGSLVINVLLGSHVGLKPSSPFHGNSSVLYALSTWHYLTILQLNAGSGLPFTLFLISSGMLMLSLYRHHRRMRVHMAGRNDAQAKAHITVLKSLVCFLILYMVYVVASPYSIKSKSFPADLTTVFISETLMAAYPSLHSVILVLGNPRVRQACQRVLWKAVRAWRS